MDDIETRVKSVIRQNISGGNSSTPTGSDHVINSLGADSVDTVGMVMALEEEFGIEISDVDAERFQTVQQIVDFVRANV